MNRRIFRLIMVVTALTLLAFGTPLAIVVRQLNQDQITVHLENDAIRAALAVPVPADVEHATISQSTRHPSHSIALYDTSGALVSGKGPSRADAAVRRALDGEPNHANIGGELVVATPLVGADGVRGAVRAAVPTSQYDSGLVRAWLLMATLAIVILLTAAIAARLEARRLSKPVEQLAVAVGRLGIGDFSVRTDRTGIPELDEAATALDATAERLGVLVERERSFSANASHQLRTPLTGIRIQLENALESPTDDDHDQIADALGAVDRLETTISDLIELSRAHTPADDHVRIDALVDAQLPSWQVLASTSNRQLRCEVPSDLPTVVTSEAAVRQILEVLVSNAFVHGGGTVTVEAGERIGGVAIEVTDEGPGLDAATWARCSTAGGATTDGTGTHGMGLPLATALAESLGGRLLLRQPGPHPRFTLLLLTPDE